MPEVNITELRNHLPEYLSRAESGEEILVTRRGRIIARLSAAHEERFAAKARLEALREGARVGDVITPIDESWEAGA